MNKLKVVHAKKLEVMHTRSVFLAHVTVYIRTCHENDRLLPTGVFHGGEDTFTSHSQGSIHPTNRSVTLDFQAAVIHHQMTADDEGFQTLDDLIARVDDHGLSGTGNFKLERCCLLLLYVDMTFYINIRLHVSIPLAFCGNDGVNGNGDAFRANIFSQNVALEETSAHSVGYWCAW